MARIVVVPCARLVANPWLSTVAIPSSEELHWAVLVKFRVVPSVKYAEAVNWSVPPRGRYPLPGGIEKVCKVGAVTVRIVKPLMPLEVAWIVVMPSAVLVASPALSIEAIAGDEELQVTPLTGLIPSVKVPVAVNCCFRPRTIDGLSGVTAIDTSVGAVTASVVDPLIPLNAA